MSMPIKIINTMYSKKKGGMERAFINYSRALAMAEFDVISDLHPNSHCVADIKEPIMLHSNLGAWDFFAKRKINKDYHAVKPNIVICHGGRAALILKDQKRNWLTIGVAHACRYKYLKPLDAIIAVSLGVKKYLMKQGIPAEKIYVLNNMIEIHDEEFLPYKPQGERIRIGYLG
jgi:glycosyltransferase involved in cell wall biosynthesis